MNNQLATMLEGNIKTYVIQSSYYTMSTDSDQKAWGEPIVGYSNGADPLYEFYKNHIGDFYWTPLDAYTNIYSDAKVCPENLSVISWILPQTSYTKQQQRESEKYPCREWVASRLNADKMNSMIAEYIGSLLRELGYLTCIPASSPYFETKRTENHVYASSWSERHAAFVSGLGTFGLCDALITPVGKAMRCGSVITNANIPPTQRAYESYNEYCLYYKNGSCMKCAQRCPANAITENGHDKVKCRNYQRQIANEYIKKQYNLESTSCGLCQTGVPCESGIPR